MRSQHNLRPDGFALAAAKGDAFRLPPGQEALTQQITPVNKNTIVVLTAGANIEMVQGSREQSNPVGGL